MKNELDRQLKAQWEAATVEDFDIDIDTEKLWHKIARPGQPQTIRLSWLKYAAALLIGAMVTFGLMQWKAPGSYALRSGMTRQAVKQAAITRQEVKESPETMPQNKPGGTSGYTHPTPGTASIASKTGTITKNEALKGEQIIPENPAPMPAARESIAQAPSGSQPARKTIHLLDLEKPAAATPKPGKFMMAIEEHLRPKSDDIAFSTKVLTRQF